MVHPKGTELPGTTKMKSDIRKAGIVTGMFVAQAGVFALGAAIYDLRIGGPPALDLQHSVFVGLRDTLLAHMLCLPPAYALIHALR